MFIDAMGKACPMPVIMAKKELDNGCTDLVIAVDNTTAVENLTRLGKELGLSVESAAKGEAAYEVHFTGEAKKAAEEAKGYAVFISRDVIGSDSAECGELGRNLMKMAVYTLSQGEDAPESILFMNSGVKLPAGSEEQVIDSLKALEEKGTKILVCGTCLNYYGIKDDLKVGTVSNMYDILGAMKKAEKVITL